MSMNGGKGGDVRMPGGFRRAAAVAIVAMLGVSSTVACSAVAELKAKMKFREANAAYQSQNYQKAIELYEETLRNDPNLTQVYFYLANSYDNLYRPGLREADPANDAKLAKAIENYELAAQKLDKPEETKLKMLSLQYLASAYGADKLNDPGKAEPVIQRMIQATPDDPANYYALAKLYEDAGAYPEAEQMLIKGKDVKPNDSAGYMQLAGFYNRQGQFDKTIEALEQRAALEPNNPEAYYMISTYYWDNAQRNVALREPEKMENVEKGLKAVERALQIRPDYLEALVYKGLLLRTEALLEKNPAKQQALIKEATELQSQAEVLKKKKTAGAD
jgi:tetratricopeptide (TPR) repeat protein